MTLSSWAKGYSTSRVRVGEAFGDWLISRTAAQVLAILISTTVAVVALDFTTDQPRLSLSALYILPISIACWSLRPRQAVAFTVVVALLSALRYPLFHPDPEVWQAINNHLGRLFSFGLNAAVLMALRRSHDRYAFLARHDMMTGFLNKGAIVDEISNLRRRPDARKGSILVSYIDLDGFKAINDSHGHAEGDAVLKAFSEELAKTFSEPYLLGRVGGDEFIIACSVPDEASTDDIAHAMHHRLSLILAHAPHPLSCSMGVTVVSGRDRRPVEAWIADADQEMYRAKHAGKNSYCLTFGRSSETPVGSERQAPEQDMFPALARAS